VESGEWRVESGEWRVESGEWRVNGEWREESEEGKEEVVFFLIEVCDLGVLHYIFLYAS